MNFPTAASFAPGVSAEGIMVSATSSKNAISYSLNASFAFFRPPSQPAKNSSTPAADAPAAHAILLFDSLLFIAIDLRQISFSKFFGGIIGRARGQRHI